MSTPAFPFSQGPPSFGSASAITFVSTSSSASSPSSSASSSPSPSRSVRFPIQPYRDNAEAVPLAVGNTRILRLKYSVGISNVPATRKRLTNASRPESALLTLSQSNLRKEPGIRANACCSPVTSLGCSCRPQYSEAIYRRVETDTCHQADFRLHFLDPLTPFRSR